MSHEPQTSRPANLLATTTTLMALVAVAAAMSGGPVLRTLEPEPRTTLGESPVVRAMAAAVAAAARDLAGIDQHASTVGLLDGAVEWFEDVSAVTRGDDLAAAPSARILAERLLDLPPPAC